MELVEGEYFKDCLVIIKARPEIKNISIRIRLHGAMSCGNWERFHSGDGFCGVGVAHNILSVPKRALFKDVDGD